MRRFGLIGRTLSHSFSGTYFTAKFETLGITDAVFELYPLETIDALPQLLKQYPDLRGLSVTIPYKTAVIPFLDELDETAARIGAVNCIAIGDKLIGHNTDAWGFRQSLKPFLTSAHDRALILGTGGASKAVKFVLDEIGIDSAFVTRDKTQVAEGQLCFAYEELNPYILQAFKLIVNTTPLGTFPAVDETPALPWNALTPEHLLYDLVYNPAETLFMKNGRQHGATAMNGYDMLKAQAEKAWEIWNGGLK